MGMILTRARSLTRCPRTRTLGDGLREKLGEAGVVGGRICSGGSVESESYYVPSRSRVHRLTYYTSLEEGFRDDSDEEVEPAVRIR